MNAGRQHGFTLIEMLLVMMIIAILIALLVPVLPGIVAYAKTQQTRQTLGQIMAGLETYKDVWGAYPPDYLINGADNRSYDGGPASLAVALQGPQGDGWDPKKHKVSRQFGPYFASLRDTLRPGKGDRMVLKDGFGGSILYYSAHMEYPFTLSEPYYNCRYRFATCRSDWYQQKDDEGASMTDAGAHEHWKKHLTSGIQYQSGKKIELPYNGTSYVLWSAGADQRFGYLRYKQENRRYVWDTAGLCDDVTSFRD